MTSAEALAVVMRQKVEKAMREDLATLWRIHETISEEIVNLTQLLDSDPAGWPEEWAT